MITQTASPALQGGERVIAIDSGLRHYTCYSYLLSRRIQFGVVVSIAVGADLEVLQFYDFADKQTVHEYMETFEEVLASRHSEEVCIFDGLPKRICRENVGVQKTGEPKHMPQFQFRQYGPYVIYYDHDIDDAAVETAVKLNALAHRLAYKYTRSLALMLLRQYKCVSAVGIHPVATL